MKNIKPALMRLPGSSILRQIVRTYRLYRNVGGIRSRKGIFTHIYENNCWGDAESASGSGSTAQATQNIRKEIPDLIRQLGVRRLLDAPCGDYNWFHLIPRNGDLHYIGGEIVAPLVLRNRERFGDKNTEFIELDITRDVLPSADLWLCRDALFHFSYRDIAKTIRNFIKSEIPYLLTSSHSECEENTDIPTGYFRLLNLQRKPFSFPPPARSIDDWIEGSAVRKLCLWDREILHSCFYKNEHFARLAR